MLISCAFVLNFENEAQASTKKSSEARTFFEDLQKKV